eukprot:TRINITY_DN7018_c0_g1_i1.p1 TRINITY_DN7018_c0_g1~~TRINITY_DN7018_c0_g1_i1.p1  ORF type:complete len:383 (-),score=133.10 TRINITY_DN7018_c0_g1_i1:174-1322(-)
MATRISSNVQSGLPRRKVTSSMAVKPGVPGSKLAKTTNRLPLKAIQNGKKEAEPKTRKTKTAARRLLKSPSSDVESMDLDKLDIVEISYKEELEKRYKDQRLPLPPGVHNIDDDENPQLCAEYAQDMYAYLRQKESKYSVPGNYLSGTRTTGKMRTVLLDWLVDVQQQFKLLPETLYLTVSIIDRFLCKEGCSIPRVKLQLVGVTAMLIASKIEEIYAPELNDFVYITDDAYTSAEVRQMELKIIRALKFDLGDPLPLNFLRRFSKAGDVDVNQHALAKYILESIMLDYSMVGVSGSLAAATSLYLSLQLLEEAGQPVTWTRSLVHYTGYTLEQVKKKGDLAVKSLVKMHSGQFSAVKNKYSSKGMLQIALNPILEARIKQH